jgi:hypothetical protein
MEIVPGIIIKWFHHGVQQFTGLENCAGQFYRYSGGKGSQRCILKLPGCSHNIK